MPRKALLRIEVVACELPVHGRFTAVGVVGVAGYARVIVYPFVQTASWAFLRCDAFLFVQSRVEVSFGGGGR